MHCVKCGNEIPDDGLFCPKCGNPAVQPSSKTTLTIPADPAVSEIKAKSKPGCLKIGLGIVAGLFALGFIGSLFPKDPNGKSGNEMAESVSASTASSSNGDVGEKPIAVTANELFSAYQANEASAQAYFGDRKLLVTGIVVKVALDIFNNPEILLRTSNQFMSAHADLADDAKSIAGDYAPGDKVQLLCQGVSEVASIPMLKDCQKAPSDLKGEPVQWKK